MTTPRGIVLIAALLVALAVGGSNPAIAAGGAGSSVQPDSSENEAAWRWPIDGPRSVTAPYRAPAHAYGAGHRGIDIAGVVEQEVRAPADGIVAFRGTVVDRPLLTIDHGSGYVSTFEPLDSSLSPGDTVTAGDVVGVVAQGGHSVVGTLHVGVRLDGVYLNPLLLFGTPPRAILLPCCAGS
ncbi:murein hydrolase activator EnvC family protein [Microbacterium sp. NPDC090003]|uniref:murein hydrolase activator EnvC family protein n=1 Tax=Microbacterium sp. NPDC090003 TaxID=3364203 RepID=UPI0037F706B7